MATKVKPWDRQLGESAQAFAAFELYRNMPPESRSLDAVARATNGQRKGNGRPTTGRLGKWSADHDWVSRAADWDAEVQAEKDRKVTAAIADAAARWARREEEKREQVYLISQELMSKVKDILGHKTTHQKIERDGGRTVVHIYPAKFTFRDAAIMAKLASELADQAIQGYSDPNAGQGLAAADGEGLSPEAAEVARRAITEAMGAADDGD